MTQPSDIAAVCPECGLPTASEEATGGLCPGCLIAATVENLSTVDHPALGRFGTIGSGPDTRWLNARLPQYEFQELLGRGGAGWVFLARQRSLDRPVAIKLLDGRNTGREDATRRFEREAQLLARLKHPRIVTVHDFGTFDDCPYLVMEYVPGPTLREILRRQPLEPEDCLRIIRQICEAVGHAHSMGVLHRDLKPENVLFDSYDRIDSLKVADFGISRLIGDTEPGFHLTQTGFVVGTPFYAAPEQMTSDAAVDTRTDIFSIGVMFYELLTGQLPRGRFPVPSQFGKASAAIDRVVLRCLESEPARRYADVGALGNALERATKSVGTRKRIVLEMSAVALLSAALVGGFLVSRGEVPNGSGGVPAQASVDSRATNESPSDPTEPATPTAEVAAAEPKPSLKVEGAGEPVIEKKAATPPTADSYITISKASIRGEHLGRAALELECRIANPEFKLYEKGLLHWVVRTSEGRRIVSTLPVAADKPEFAIRDQIFTRITDRLPMDVYLEEEWYVPAPGTRRVSNVVRVDRTASGFGIDSGPTFYIQDTGGGQFPGR